VSASKPPKVLYVCHNHPANRPGGAEVYAHELYRAMRASGEFEPVFAAKVGTPFSSDAAHQGTRFALAGADPNEYLVHTSRGEFDMVFSTARRKRLYTEDWRSFLRAQKPDIVHFQHTLYLGYDMLRATRAELPHAPILYTLHEFLPICYRNGKMVRSERVQSESPELCDHGSPRRCNQCFPEISVQTFFLRERFIKAAFDHVDLFIAPSEHLRRRFVEWGIPEAKIRFEDYGRIPIAALPDPPDAGRRRRIGFIGQITPFKGVDVLLEAMTLLAAKGVEVELVLHGGNLEFQTKPFQAKIKRLLGETEANIRFAGTYSNDRLPSILSALDWVVVPSVWWENAPLVIQESLMCARPTICSNIGGMAEKVCDGVDGLHFRVGDPRSLAAVIERAVSTPGLWDSIRAQITGPHPMEQHLMVLGGFYHELLERSAARALTAA
jgi:glycosyltransferase involved in cell wall biosynthesis